MTPTALLVIDVQDSFPARPSWQAVSTPDIVARTQELVGHARGAGDLVVWVLHSEPGTGTVFDPVNGLVRLQTGLTPTEEEPVIVKSSANAFTTTGLAQLLTLHGIRRLRICGIQTERCCETTARVGSDLGFEIDFVIDATATFPIPHRDAPADRPYAEVLADPRTLGVGEIIERTEYALAGRFARITTLQEVNSTAPAVA